MRPAIVDLEFTQNASVKVHIQTNIESLIAGIDSSHDDTDDSPQTQRYNQLRALSSSQLSNEFKLLEASIISEFHLAFDGIESDLSLVSLDIPAIGNLDKSRLSSIHLLALIPSPSDNTQQVTWQYAQRFGNNIAHFYYDKTPQEKTSHWLTNGAISPPFQLNTTYAPKSFTQVAVEYSVLGFEHIVPKGLDHILFVLGLFLLSIKLRPLLLQVTAFTLAHSITLGLTIYGVISLSPSIVEPLIALSIVAVGIENIFVKTVKARRVVVVFLFGLLHAWALLGCYPSLDYQSQILLPHLCFLMWALKLASYQCLLLPFCASFG